MWSIVSFIFLKYLGVILLDFIIPACLTLKKLPKCFSTQLYPFAFISNKWCFVDSIPTATLAFSVFLIFWYSSVYMLVYYYGFNFYFSVTADVKYLFMLFAIPVFLAKYLIKILLIFLKKLGCSSFFLNLTDLSFLF